MPFDGSPDSGEVVLVNDLGENLTVEKALALMPADVPPDRRAGYTDADGTAFVYDNDHIALKPEEPPGDIGLQVFVHDIMEPDFFRWPPSEFDRLLLDDPFRNALREVRDSWGKIPGASEKDPMEAEWFGIASYILDGTDDAVLLYTKIYEMRQDKSRPVWSPELLTLISAFGRIVTRVDKEIVRAQPIFDHYLSGRLLMRTRTLPGAGEEVRRVNLKIRAAVDRLFGNGHRGFRQPHRLHVDVEKLAALGVTGLKTARKTPNYYDSPTTAHAHPALVKIFKAMCEGGGTVQFATTNIAHTVVAATESSDLKFLLHQSRDADWLVAVSNRLETTGDGKFFGPNLEGNDYVYGVEKLRLVRENLKERNSRRGDDLPYVNLLGAGDSLGNDGAIIMEALAHNGLGLVSCSTVEIGRKKFAPMIDRMTAALGRDPQQILIPQRKQEASLEIDLSGVRGANIEEQIRSVRQRLIYAPLLKGIV